MSTIEFTLALHLVYIINTRLKIACRIPILYQKTFKPQGVEGSSKFGARDIQEINKYIVWIGQIVHRFHKWVAATIETSYECKLEGSSSVGRSCRINLLLTVFYYYCFFYILWDYDLTQCQILTFKMRRKVHLILLSCPARSGFTPFRIGRSGPVGCSSRSVTACEVWSTPNPTSQVPLSKGSFRSMSLSLVLEIFKKMYKYLFRFLWSSHLISLCQMLTLW